GFYVSTNVDIIFFFFFKQKTAYEIGLGIPAEPLFRSKIVTLTLADDRLEAFYDNPNALRDYFRDIGRMVLAAEGRKANDSHADRSEERRVGKECRSRWWPYQ